MRFASWAVLLICTRETKTLVSLVIDTNLPCDVVAGPRLSADSLSFVGIGDALLPSIEILPSLCSGDNSVHSPGKSTLAASSILKRQSLSRNARMRIVRCFISCFLPLQELLVRLTLTLTQLHKCILHPRDEAELVQYIRGLTERHIPPTRQMIINSATPLCR
jgi:hypothetical protein